MRRNQLTVPILVFLAGFALSLALDVRSLVSSMMHAGSAEAQAQVIATRAGQQRQYWEYRVVSRDGSQSSSQTSLEAELTRLGEQGFEVFSVTQTSRSDVRAFDLTIILRRLKY